MSGFNTMEVKNTKIVVDMLGEIPEIDLPDGWIGVAHKTGGIVYMHKDTRVVTWSRPYQISRFASLRKHDAPLISIPCLHQLRAQRSVTSLKRKNTKKHENSTDSMKKVKLGSEISIEATNTTEATDNNEVEFAHSQESPEAIETDNENTAIKQTSSTEVTSNGIASSSSSSAHSDVFANASENDDQSTIINHNSLPGFDTVDFDTLHAYIGKIFDFKNDVNDKLPIFSDEKLKKSQSFPVEKKKPTITTDNKSPLQVLHEYTHNILKQKFVAEKLEIENFVNFCVQIVIADLRYGIAQADTIKKAKQDAAAFTLNILEPSLLLDKQESENDPVAKKLDDVDIEDGDIVHTARKTKGMQMPYKILLQLMERNFEDFKERDLEQCSDDDEHVTRYTLRYKKREDMHVTVSVSTENGNLGREFAAQSMIKKLYPNLQCWGSIVRLSKQKRPVVVKEETDSKPTNKYMMALKDAMRKVGGMG